MLDGIIGIVIGAFAGCFLTVLALSLATAASDRDDNVMHKKEEQK